MDLGCRARAYHRRRYVDSNIPAMAVVRDRQVAISRAGLSMALRPEPHLHRYDNVGGSQNGGVCILITYRNAFLAGIVLSVCIVQLPQRFMTVNGLSPLAAGARLLPFGAFAPVGASISAGLMDKARIPPVYICVVGMILEIIGLVFLSRASGDRHINASQYGFQIITAVGNGYLQTASVLLIPYIVQNRDLGEFPPH